MHSPPQGRGLEAIAYKRAVEGRETIIIRGEQEVARRITPSDAILGLFKARRHGWRWFAEGRGRGGSHSERMARAQALR